MFAVISIIQFLPEDVAIFVNNFISAFYSFWFLAMLLVSHFQHVLQLLYGNIYSSSILVLLRVGGRIGERTEFIIATLSQSLPFSIDMLVYIKPFSWPLLLSIAKSLIRIVC